MISLLRLVRSTLFTLMVFGLVATSVHAEGGASFALRPVRYDPERPATQSYFIYDGAAPGQSVRDEVQVHNTGLVAGTVRLYAVDATTGQTSGAVYLSEGNARDKVAAWITLDELEVTLAPGEERAIGFTLTVPADAQPGQHLGGLVAQDIVLQSGTSEGALQINMQTRTVTAVQVNVPGPVVEDMTILDIKPTVQQGYQMVQLGLRNDGTHMTKPQGALTISDLQGNLIQQVPLQLDTFLPGTEIQYPVMVPGQALAAGSYRAAVHLTYGTSGVATAEMPLEISAAQVTEIYEAAGQALPPVSTLGAAPALPMMLLGGMALTAVLGAIVGGLVILTMSRRRARESAGG